MLIDLIKTMDRGYDAKQPQMWPVYGTGKQLDRTSVVTASEIGYCARMIKFNKLAMKAGGYNPEFGTKGSSRDEWGFFERGHVTEAWVVEMIHAGWIDDPAEFNLIHTGADQVSFADGYQGGTPDGIFVNVQGYALGVGILEVKSIDPRTNIRNLPKTVHVAQVMQNLDLVASKFEGVPLGGEIIYVNASDYKKRYQFHVPWDEALAIELEEKAQRIMETADPADLPADGLFTGDCQYCNHTMQCNAIIAEQRNEKGSINALDKAARGLFAR